MLRYLGRSSDGEKELDGGWAKEVAAGAMADGNGLSKSIESAEVALLIAVQ